MYTPAREFSALSICVLTVASMMTKAPLHGLVSSAVRNTENNARSARAMPSGSSLSLDVGWVSSW